MGCERFADNFRPACDDIGRGKPLRCEHGPQGFVEQIGEGADGGLLHDGSLFLDREPFSLREKVARDAPDEGLAVDK
jgi:hypothetical protein